MTPLPYEKPDQKSKRRRRTKMSGKIFILALILLGACNWENPYTNYDLDYENSKEAAISSWEMRIVVLFRVFYLVFVLGLVSGCDFNEIYEMINNPTYEHVQRDEDFDLYYYTSLQFFETDIGELRDIDIWQTRRNTQIVYSDDCGDGRIGSYNTADYKICVLSGLDPELEVLTIVHEFVHVFEFEYFHDLSQNHENRKIWAAGTWNSMNDAGLAKDSVEYKTCEAMLNSNTQ